MNCNCFLTNLINSIIEKHNEVAGALNLSTQNLSLIEIALAIAILLSRFINSNKPKSDLLDSSDTQKQEIAESIDVAEEKTEDLDFSKFQEELERLNEKEFLLEKESEKIKEEKNVPTPKVVTESKPRDIKAGLATTRKGFFGAIKELFLGKEKLTPEMLEELEMMLVSSDLGVSTVSSILPDLKLLLKENDKKDVTQEEVVGILKQQISKIMSAGDDFEYAVSFKQEHKPHVLMIVGVNGAGKTTSIAKLSNNFVKQGKKVMIAAADTFRAAAVEQIKVWGERLNVPVITGNENAKPSAVIFDAMVKAKEEGVDILIVDTAGRLHTKSNLMQELEGAKNIMKRHDESAPHDVFLVIDGTTGQNGLIQAKEFNEAAGLTGIVVTKLDGTSKGGIVVAIKKELGVPVRYIG